MSRRAFKLDNKGKLVVEERDVQAAVVEFLEAHGCVVLENRSKKWNALADCIAGNKAGVGSPDLVVAIPAWKATSDPGKCIFIELKRKGGKQSAAQREWQRRLEAIGHKYLLVEDVDQIIKEWEKI